MIDGFGLNNDIAIHFEGPFTFSDGENCIFTSAHANSEGIYLWTFQQKRDGSHLIHYVGETQRFAYRHREHLALTLGLMYGIFDPDEAAEGRSVRVFDGLWRDRSPQGPVKVMAEYMSLKDMALRYVSSLSVFFAPTNIESKDRKNIEGWIGWNLRDKHPEATVLYPSDNRVGRCSSKRVDSIFITCDATILGLDDEISCLYMKSN